MRPCTTRSAISMLRDARICNGSCRATSSSSFSPGRQRYATASSARHFVRSPGSRLSSRRFLLLLLMQVQFLPFHSSFITWTQRISLFADLILLAWRGESPVQARTWSPVPGLVGHWRRPRSRGPAVLLDGRNLSWRVAGGDLPSWPILPAIKSSEPQRDQSTQHAAQSAWEWAKGYWDWIRTSEKVSLHDWVFNSPVDFTTRRRWLPISSTLVLSGLNIYEGLNIDDPKKAEWREFVFRPRGRDLRGAIFGLASLPKVDFEGAKLQGASLYRAHFRARHSKARSFRARRLKARSFRARTLQCAASGSFAGCANFRARRLKARNFRVRRSKARSFRGRRSEARDFRGLRSKAHGFRVRRSKARSFKGRRSKART